MHIVKKKKISSLFPSTQEVFTSAVPTGASGDLQASKVTLGILTGGLLQFASCALSRCFSL